MDRRKFFAAFGGIAAVVLASKAFATRGAAIIDHAVPGVGLTVSGPVREVKLYFTLGVAAARVQVMSAAGKRVRASEPFIDPASREIVTVKLGRALQNGTYQVSWDVLSIAGWSTWGTFYFTVN
jgi:methionine-rich copper-binding protein CopC